METDASQACHRAQQDYRTKLQPNENWLSPSQRTGFVRHSALAQEKLINRTYLIALVLDPTFRHLLRQAY